MERKELACSWYIFLDKRKAPSIPFLLPMANMVSILLKLLTFHAMLSLAVLENLRTFAHGTEATQSTSIQDRAGEVLPISVNVTQANITYTATVSVEALL